jgi:hypothetical protein
MTCSTVRVPKTPSETATYTTAAIPSARYMAFGSSREGSFRSLAVKVTMPNPRKAKNVSATLETMSRSGDTPKAPATPG